MALNNVLDSDVDRLTMYAIRGVNAFIALYEDERPEESAIAAGPVARRSSPRAPVAKKTPAVAKKAQPALQTSSKKSGGKAIRR
jgi:hypothetical protein